MNTSYNLWQDELDTKEYSIDLNSSIHQVIQSIEFERDSNYRINAKAYGSRDTSTNNKINSMLFKINDVKKGIDKFNAHDEYNIYNIDVEYLHIKTIHYQANKFCAEGEIFKLTKSIKTAGVSEYIILYYLNTNKDIIYTRGIHIETNESKEISIPDFIHNTFDYQSESETSRNGIVLRLKNMEFVFGYVTEKKTNNYIGTFIRFKENTFPSEDEAKVIESFLSFIFGTKLIPIGYTKYNKFHSPTELCYISSYHNNIEQIINSPKNMPIPISYHPCHFKEAEIESLLNLLLKNYDELFKEFHFYDIVWYINCHRILPMELQLQPLSTAFELLNKSWFNSSKSKTKGKNINDDSYVPIINNYIQNIKDALIKLTKHHNHDSIIKKILSANQMGPNERSRVFFEELELKISEVENKALKERNTSIHGTLKGFDYEKLFYFNRSYYTLLNRILLKLIKYDKEYVDYSTFTNSIKHIDSFLGGPNDDCKI